MAVTARFQADFSGFIAAIDKAEIALVDMSKGASKVEGSLNRMVDNFSGRKLIQEASLMTIALEKSGGIATLTGKELEQVGTKANEAADKMKKLGIDVPAGLQKLADSTKQAKVETGGLGAAFGELNGVLSLFGIGLSVSALVGFAKGAIDSAARLGDLSVATGLSTDSLQRLAAVGRGFGVDIDQMSTAVGNLSKRLASGDASAVSAVQMLGQNVTDVIASGPTEAFLSLAEAVSHVEDPMRKGALASALFGDKLAKVLIPALGDLRKKMDEVPQDAVISPAIIERANQFNTSIANGVTRIEAWAAKILFAYANGAAATEAAKKALEGLAGAHVNVAAAQGPVITTAELLANKLKALRSEAYEPLTKAQEANVGELLFFGVSLKEIAELVGTNESRLRLYIEAEKATTEEQKRMTAEGEKWADMINGISLNALKNSQKEFEAWSAKLTMVTDKVSQAILAESAAQTELNASHGLTAMGANKVTSADETLRAGLEALQRTEIVGISQAAQKQLLIDAYTKSLYDSAVAQDRATAGLAQVQPIAAATSTAIDNLTKSYWAAVDAAAALAGIPDIGHRPPSITDPDWQRTHPNGGLNPGGGLHPLRDMGGPVLAGRSYLIGRNRQPELFTPGASGFITPLGGGGSIVNHFYVNGTADDVARQIADKVIRTVMQAKKLGSA